ncbi:MAG: hypothetical protein LBC37_03835 [Zoogloeaceae bacterium]|nr:hypothetical protein [Zoogloeaceae bacterium]
MAADDLEYYRSFYTNYRHPYGVKDRISKESAQELDAYLIAKRDKKNRIISLQQIHDKGNQCRFHMEYTYQENGDLFSYEIIKNCRPYLFEPPADIVREHGNTSFEYYRFMRTIVHDDTSRFDFSGRITKEEAEDLDDHIVVERDKNARIIAVENFLQKRSFLVFGKKHKERNIRIEHVYRENGELYSYKRFE